MKAGIRVRAREDDIEWVGRLFKGWKRVQVAAAGLRWRENLSFVVSHSVAGGVYVDEVFTSKGWRGKGVAEGMLQRAVGGAHAELMVREEGRKGEEADGEPWRAYERMGLVRGVLGAAGDTYGAVEGCRYMKGRLRAGAGTSKGCMLTELGKVTEVVGWENLTAEMGILRWNGWFAARMGSKRRMRGRASGGRGSQAERGMWWFSTRRTE